VTHEYEGLIPAFTSVLGEEGGRLLARKWSDPVMWAVALPVIVIDIAVLALMWKRA
jgi:multisubunit Na+/H+ antiporter MnhC subunit